MRIVQVEQNDFMAKGGQAGNRSATTIFGIAGMTSADDNLDLPRD